MNGRGDTGGKLRPGRGASRCGGGEAAGRGVAVTRAGRAVGRRSTRNAGYPAFSHSRLLRHRMSRPGLRQRRRSDPQCAGARLRSDRHLFLARTRPTAPRDGVCEKSGLGGWAGTPCFQTRHARWSRLTARSWRAARADIPDPPRVGHRTSCPRRDPGRSARRTPGTTRSARPSEGGSLAQLCAQPWRVHVEVQIADRLVEPEQVRGPHVEEGCGETGSEWVREYESHRHHHSHPRGQPVGFHPCDAEWETHAGEQGDGRAAPRVSNGVGRAGRGRPPGAPIRKPGAVYSMSLRATYRVRDQFSPTAEESMRETAGALPPAARGRRAPSAQSRSTVVCANARSGCVSIVSCPGTHG